MNVWIGEDVNNSWYVAEVRQLNLAIEGDLQQRNVGNVRAFIISCCGCVLSVYIAGKPDKMNLPLEIEFLDASTAGTHVKRDFPGKKVGKGTRGSDPRYASAEQFKLGRDYSRQPRSERYFTVVKRLVSASPLISCLFGVNAYHRKLTCPLQAVTGPTSRIIACSCRVACFAVIVLHLTCWQSVTPLDRNLSYGLPQFVIVLRYQQYG